MNVYRIEVKVAATMYVKAINEMNARMKASEWDVTLVGLEQEEYGVPVSDAHSTHPALPEVSLSPVGTLYVGKMKTVEEV